MNQVQYEDFKRKVLNEYEYPERNIILELMRFFEESNDIIYPDPLHRKKLLKKDWSKIT